jgi:hypothetical protein
MALFQHKHKKVSLIFKKSLIMEASMIPFQFLWIEYKVWKNLVQ